MSDDFQLSFEKHVLDNGLEVVLHPDATNPVVSTCVVYHVGSAREHQGITGFAHLFEHLMFEGSQNVGEGEHFKRISEAGGTLNGTTSRDRTNYFETLPAHQLELALWLESDRMGFLLPAVSQEKLDNQRDVVKNERRQSYENRPYAKALWPIAEALYPAEHPYSWLTIGSHEDLDAAQLDTVRDFFRRWYGPNNATLCIGGDFDKDRALELVKKYFGPIPRGPEVPRMDPWPVTLDHDVRRVVEDSVQLPELTFVWPTPPRHDEDEAALSLLLLVLSANKSALLDRALTVDRTLASQVLAYHNVGELAGEMRITVRAAPGVSLDTIEQEVRRVLDQLAQDGVDPQQLDRQKNQNESQFLQQLETVAERTNLLAELNAVYGDPSLATQDLERLRAVTPQQLEDVFRRTVLGKPAVLMSVIPEGRHDLAATGRTPQQVEAEGAVDRSHPPAAREPRPFHSPQCFAHDCGEGVAILSSKYERLPLAAVYLSAPGGHLREQAGQEGISRLAADLLEEGTESLSATEFTDELDAIGAQLQVNSGDEEISIFVQSLRSHLPRALELLHDVVLRPRLAESDFQRLRQQQLTLLDTRKDHARALADLAWRRVLFGAETLAGSSHLGNRDSLAQLDPDTIRGFLQRNFVRAGARVCIAGSFADGEIEELLRPLCQDWQPGTPDDLEMTHPLRSAGNPIYLVDKPGAAQTELRVGHAGVARTHPDWDRLGALNYILGGSFNSRINSNLREDKGYTYGAFSSFSAGPRHGAFTASTAVHTESTADALRELLSEIHGIRDGIRPDEVEFAQRSLIEAMGRRYETVQSFCSLHAEILRYGLPHDFLERRIQILAAVDSAELDRLAAEHIRPEELAIVAVGDAEKIRADLEGIGSVVDLDAEGIPLAASLG